MTVAIFVSVCILFDIVTGLIKAGYTGTLNSTALRQGLMHKASEILTVIGAYLLQHGMVQIGLTFEVPVYTPVALYIALMEIVSVIENLCAVNPALARILSPYLEKLKDSQSAQVPKIETNKEGDTDESDTEGN